jgi:hypothetical protein
MKGLSVTEKTSSIAARIVLIPTYRPNASTLESYGLRQNSKADVRVVDLRSLE